jgi:signal transduction histidine kinase
MVEQGWDQQQQINLLNRLLEVSLILNSNLALKPLLHFIMEATCEITSSEAASILLYDHNADELHFAASNTPNTDADKLAEIRVPMEGSIAGQIVRENHPIMIQDASDSNVYRTVDNKIGFRTRSLLGVPMQIKGEVIGVLEAVNKVEGQWTNDDRDYLSILAAQAAVAIQNARQAEALQSAYDELSKLDKLKNDFIAIASHELRTPLGVILGYASFLKEEAQGEASEHASAVLNSALHLRNLIEDMTNLRYLQLGQAELIREPVPVAALLEAAEHDAYSLVTAKGHSLELNIEGGDALVNVDRLKLGMALTNILNNAIKFTPNGGKITLSIAQRPREAWIMVSDNGIGIPDGQAEKIFDEFYQVEDHMTRRHNGMGIGLSIARGMVQAHGGRLWAESEGTGKGSTFYIALPLAQEEEPVDRGESSRL